MAASPGKRDSRAASRSRSCPSGHGVAQLGLVIDEGHEPHVRVSMEEWTLQDQHSASPGLAKDSPSGLS